MKKFGFLLREQWGSLENSKEGSSRPDMQD